MSKTYFLFGDQAVNKYQDDGLQAMIEAYDDNIISYETFEWVDGETKPQDILAVFIGHGDYCIITEEEYNQL